MIAPVLILVYDRLEHFQKCMESLANCDLAQDTTVYISSDAAYIPEHEIKIEKVREYIKTLTQFKEVVPIFHETNQGLIRSMEKSIDTVFRKYDRLIFLEDDNIVSEDFLNYMNQGLTFYQNDPRVFTVSGFSQSIFFDVDPNKLNKTYFTHRHCPWGFGTWRSKYLRADAYSTTEVLRDLHDKKFISRLNEIGIDLLPSFKHIMQKGKMLTADYLFVYHMIKNNLVTVAPYVTKTFNTGNDGSGSRTSRNSRFINHNLSSMLEKNEFSFSDDIYKNLDNSFNKRLNDTKKNRIKKRLDKMGLLRIGYALHQLKKKWK